MSISQDRLNFVLDFHTQLEVSELTGIPQSTISFVSNGIRELPSEYYQSLYNVYRNEAYDYLKETGLSNTNAQRLRSLNPNNLKMVVEKLNMIMDNLSINLVGDYQNDEGVILNEDEARDLFYYYREGIQENMRNSESDPYRWFDNYL